MLSNAQVFDVGVGLTMILATVVVENGDAAAKDSNSSLESEVRLATGACCGNANSCLSYIDTYRGTGRSLASMDEHRPSPSV